MTKMLFRGKTRFARKARREDDSKIAASVKPSREPKDNVKKIAATEIAKSSNVAVCVSCGMERVIKARGQCDRCNRESARPGLCARCGRKTVIHAKSLCSSCYFSNLKPPKKTRNVKLIFDKDSELYDRIIKEAKNQYRSVECQILYILSRHYDMSGETK